MGVPHRIAAQHAAEPSPTTGIALPLPLFRSSSVSTTRIRQSGMDNPAFLMGSSVRVSGGAFEVIHEQTDRHRSVGGDKLCRMGCFASETVEIPSRHHNRPYLMGCGPSWACQAHIENRPLSCIGAPSGTSIKWGPDD